MLTFGDCKSDEGLLAVAGVCANTPRFAYLVNASVRRIERRGDWAGTIAPVQVCATRGCVSFPRYVGHVRKVNLCNRELPVKNPWYQFIEQRSWRCGSWQPHLSGEAVLFANGFAPTYSDVWGDGRLIRAYPRVREDIGKTVRIFGVDNDNQPLRTNNNDGTWSDGIVITLTDPFGSTSTYVRRIDRVVKEVTQGQVFLFGYDVANDALEDLAIYDPGETSPSYERFKLNQGFAGAPQTTCSPCCATARSIIALVKLKVIEARFDTDWVIIDNLEALKFMVQSVRAAEAGDRDLSNGYMVDAIAECNRDLENAFPDDQFAVRNDVIGRRTYSNRCF